MADPDETSLPTTESRAALVSTVGVVGAGQMGGGIAQVAAASGLTVVLVDASLELAERGKARIATVLAKQVDKGKMAAQARDELLARIRCASGPADFGGCDFVIEAATEALELKVAILRKCDAALAPGKWLASNTSSI
jgi:3-hydroxybutyryl-CoA dehydrogenase